MRTRLPLALIFLCACCGRSGMGLGRDGSAGPARGRDAGGNQTVVPAVKGDTAGWMADQCKWSAPEDPGAPAVAIAMSDAADATSFRVRIAIHASAYAHHGFVSVPWLGEKGPQSGQGMEVRGPSPGATQGEYFFDLFWANQLAPREGMKITLTASFSFACSPSMSLTFDATTTAELILCREGAGGLAWRGPGETCDT